MYQSAPTSPLDPARWVSPPSRPRHRRTIVTRSHRWLGGAVATLAWAGWIIVPSGTVTADLPASPTVASAGIDDADKVPAALAFRSGSPEPVNGGDSPAADAANVLTAPETVALDSVAPATKEAEPLASETTAPEPTSVEQTSVEQTSVEPLLVEPATTVAGASAGLDGYVDPGIDQSYVAADGGSTLSSAIIPLVVHTRVLSSTTTTLGAVTTTARATTTSSNTTSSNTTSSNTTLSTTKSSTTTLAPSTGPVLVFEDNFTSLDTTRWRPEFSTYGDGNHELQCYLPQQVAAEAGALTLRARRADVDCVSGDPRTVVSGMVRSSGITFRPGQRIEFRARMDVADTTDMGGLWPAFWASSWHGGGWPRGGELDVLEWLSRDRGRSHHSLHWLNDSGRHQVWSNKSAVDLTNAWHTYTFDWTTSELRWLVDGTLVASVDPRGFATIDGRNPFADADAVITQFKINLALGGDWGGPLGATALDRDGSTAYRIDYVRIYNL